MSENIFFLYEIKVTMCEQNFTADIFRTLAKKLCVDDFNILLLVGTEIMQATDHDHFLIENEASFIKQDQNHTSCIATTQRSKWNIRHLLFGINSFPSVY